MNGWIAAGLAAAVISLIDPVPYLRDIVNGRTRPHRSTWCIWSVLGVTAFVSQWADGASWSLLMLGIQATTVTLVFLLSLSRGVGGVGPADVALVGVAAAGIAGWIVLSQPLVAMACVILADLAAFGLMLPKTWRDPRSETLSTYLLSSAAGVLGAAAVGSVQLDLLLYPAYFTLVNGATGAIIIMRRRVSPIPAATGGLAPGQPSCQGGDSFIFA